MFGDNRKALVFFNNLVLVLFIIFRELYLITQEITQKKPML